VLASLGVDTSVEISGGHDFAVRNGALVMRIVASTASSAQRSVTIAKRRSSRAGDAMLVIFPSSQAKSCATDWHDGQISRRAQNDVNGISFVSRTRRGMQ
jgi:hypothetical protein